ncbi:MAG: GatB/YqeY domain-containing protein [Desulfobacteraceae bacterium]|nr:GatB/YqeY domain-containing protein [Desulfobacteraceae bacterium]
MRLQEKIKADLIVAMKAKNEEKKNVLRVILGEFGRLEQKEISDAETIKIIKKLVKSEKEVLSQRGSKSTNDFIKIAETYLPQMAGEDEIRSYIESNIDFSQFKNKMQAMGSIMKHFGSSADGNLVKKVLQSM